MPFVHPNSMLVVTTNGAGVVIEAVYLVIYLWYSDPKKRIRVALAVLIEVIAFCGLVVLVLIFLHTTHQRSAIVGTISVAANILMYSSPLSFMVRHVICKLSIYYFVLCNIRIYCQFVLHCYGLIGFVVHILQRLVITTKSVEYMPFLLSFFSFNNGLCWCLYAFFPFDPFIAVSNFFSRAHFCSGSVLCMFNYGAKVSSGF